MWSKITLFLQNYRFVLSGCFFIGCVSPIFPFVFWLITHYQKVESKDYLQVPIKIDSFKPKERFEGKNLQVKVTQTQELFPNFSDFVTITGFNYRVKSAANRAIRLSFYNSSEVIVEEGVPFFIGFNDSKTWGVVAKERALFEAKVENQVLSAQLIREPKEAKSYLLSLKAKKVEDASFRYFKEALQRCRFLGKDVIFFDKTGHRLFDGSTDTIIPLCNDAILTFIDGKINLAMQDVGQQLGPIAKVVTLKDQQLQLTLMDSSGFYSESMQLQLEKTEKLGAKVELVLKPLKAHGYKRVWSKNLHKELCVGDWLAEKNGELFSTDGANTSLQGLIYFREIKKEGRTSFAYFDVFDRLHTQKETLKIALESKQVSAPVQSPKGTTKQEKRSPSKMMMKELPGMIDPLLDDTDMDMDFED